MMTAISVAKECKMVNDGEEIVTAELDSPVEMRFSRINEVMGETEVNNENITFAMSGSSWALARKHLPGLLHKVIN